MNHASLVASRVSEPALGSLYDYSRWTYERSAARFGDLDAKAGRVVAMAGVVGGLSLVGGPELAVTTAAIDFLWLVSTVLLLGAGVCSLGAIVIRDLLAPPSVREVVSALSDDELSKQDLLSRLIINFGDAERSYDNANLRKARWVDMAQLLATVGIAGELAFLSALLFLRWAG